VQASKSIVEKTMKKEGFRLIKEEFIPRHPQSYLPKECLGDILRLYSKVG
jgi:hypothetical protein